jgi:Zn-dependent protease
VRGAASLFAGGGRKGRGLFVGRFFEIEFYLDYSWFIIAAFVTYTLTSQIFPAWAKGMSPGTYLAMGVAGALLFFFSIILHELGHSLVSQRCGIPVPRITLLLIGGLAEISREPDDARSELKIAIGGPAVSVALAAGFFLLGALFAFLHLTAVAAVCNWLAATNGVLVVFNMVPGYPLDGGRILRALLWAKSGKLRWATYVASRIGIGFSWLLLVLGLLLLIGPMMRGNMTPEFGGFVYLFIALFLKSAAETGYTQTLHKEVLTGVVVRDIMTPAPITIPATLPLNLVVDEYFLTNHHVAFPVVDPTDGSFRGLLRLDFLKAVPREKWPYTSAGDLAAARETTDLKIEAGSPAARAMRQLLAADSGRLAVVENGKTVGIVTRHDILHFIEIHTELEDM